MTSLQLGLIIAGVALVAGVFLYNWMQERRIRRQIDEAFRRSTGATPAAAAGDSAVEGRIEPTLPGALPENAPRTRASDASSDEDYEAPLAIQNRIASDLAPASPSRAPRCALAPSARGASAGGHAPQPDPEIECVVTLQPVRPVAPGARGGTACARGQAVALVRAAPGRAAVATAQVRHQRANVTSSRVPAARRSAGPQRAR
jgi:hypothetical protein